MYLAQSLRRIQRDVTRRLRVESSVYLSMKTIFPKSEVKGLLGDWQCTGLIRGAAVLLLRRIRI